MQDSSLTILRKQRGVYTDSKESHVRTKLNQFLSSGVFVVLWKVAVKQVLVLYLEGSPGGI